jgi:hypothetical protein
MFNFVEGYAVHVSGFYAYGVSGAGAVSGFAVSWAKAV